MKAQRSFNKETFTWYATVNIDGKDYKRVLHMGRVGFYIIINKKKVVITEFE